MEASDGAAPAKRVRKPKRRIDDACAEEVAGACRLRASVVGSDSAAEWPVESLVKHKINRSGHRKYLVKWLGAHPPSWEPKNNVGSLLVEDYEQRYASLVLKMPPFKGVQVCASQTCGHTRFCKQLLIFCFSF